MWRGACGERAVVELALERAWLVRVESEGLCADHLHGTLLGPDITVEVRVGRNCVDDPPSAGRDQVEHRPVSATHVKRVLALAEVSVVLSCLSRRVLGPTSGERRMIERAIKRGACKCGEHERG